MALKLISFFCSLTDATTSVRTSPGCLSGGTLWESWTGPTKPDGSWRARQPPFLVFSASRVATQRR